MLADDPVHFKWQKSDKVQLTKDMERELEYEISRVRRQVQRSSAVTESRLRAEITDKDVRIADLGDRLEKMNPLLLHNRLVLLQGYAGLSSLSPPKRN